MHLISVNIGQERDLKNGKQVERTGIYKQPSDSPVYIGTLGLKGDAVVDSKHHGGEDQAVYVYGRADYDWWQDQIGRELPAGVFGDNLTVDGLESQRFSIGDRLRVGDVLLEVTAPRIPCGTLAARMGDPEFVKKFRHAERPGLYCRVIETGDVKAGDPVTHEPFKGDTITLTEMFRSWYDMNELDAATFQRFLAAPIDIRSRREFEERLEKLTAAG